MRKLIVLIMTSVLATGAVANADQLNISENPDGYILINGVYNSSGKISDGGNITPKFMESDYSSNVWDADEALTMSADVYDDGNLDHVAFCFYDSNAIDEEDVDDNCDKLERDAGGKLVYAVSDGDNRPSALSAFYMDDPSGVVFNTSSQISGHPATGDIWKRADRHFVASETQGVAPSTVTNATATLKGQSQSVKSIEVNFALSDLAAKSDGWTFRVLAVYEDGAGYKEVVSTSPESFNVKYVGTVDTGDGTTNRGQLFWQVAAGSEQTQGPISTGTYRANNTSDITLKAGGLWDDLGSNQYAWGTDSDPSGTDISMSCNAEEQDPVFMGLSVERFLLDVPSLMGAETPVTAKNGEDLPMGDHVCTVYVGPDAEAGTYDANMTVGILEKVPAV